VTARLRVLFGFVVMEVGRRRILHYNVTAHQTADWTLQRFREAIPSDHSYRFVIHDHDSIFSRELDQQLRSDFKLKVCALPCGHQRPTLIVNGWSATVRREYLDFITPLNERHLRMTLCSWVTHYDKGRLHSSLGPGVPEKSSDNPLTGPKNHRRRDCHEIVRSKPGRFWAAVYITNTVCNSASLERRRLLRRTPLVDEIQPERTDFESDPYGGSSSLRSKAHGLETASSRDYKSAHVQTAKGRA
jgi:hypothetical protein